MQKSKRKVSLIVAILLVFFVLVLLYFFLIKKLGTTLPVIDNRPVMTNTLSEEEKNIVEKASQLVNMPKDEEATVATIVDKTKNQKLDFLKDAENGDKIIIFPKSGKQFLYREETNTIISTATLNEE